MSEIQEFECKRCEGSGQPCIYCGGTGRIVREVWGTEDRMQHMSGVGAERNNSINDRYKNLLIKRDTERARATATPPKRVAGKYHVFDVRPEHSSITEIDTFRTMFDAQACANEVLQGSFRLIYEHDRFRGGMCWEPASNERWDHAKRIVALAYQQREQE